MTFVKFYNFILEKFESMREEIIVYNIILADVKHWPDSIVLIELVGI
jgi:hypothetical protein